MKSPQSRLWRSACAAALVAGLVLPAAYAAEPAAAWPSKPVRILVGYPPGGSVDSAARVMAQALASATGQPFVVENRAGADGTIAMGSVVRAPADGYLLAVSVRGAISVAPAVAKLPFDPIADLSAIAPIGQTAELFVTRRKSGITQLSQLGEGFRRNGNKLSIGYIGALPRLLAELLAQESRVDLLRVPYKGLPQAMQDLLGDQTDMLVGDAVGLIVEQVAAGNLVPLAVTSAQRLPALPQVPTVAEAGLPALAGNQWYALFGPRDLPADLVARINTLVNANLRQPAQVEQLARAGLSPFPGTATELAAVVARETQFWKDVAARAGIKPE